MCALCCYSYYMFVWCRRVFIYTCVSLCTLHAIPLGPNLLCNALLIVLPLCHARSLQTELRGSLRHLFLWEESKHRDALHEQRKCFFPSGRLQRAGRRSSLFFFYQKSVTWAESLFNRMCLNVCCIFLCAVISLRPSFNHWASVPLQRLMNDTSFPQPRTLITSINNPLCCFCCLGHLTILLPLTLDFTEVFRWSHCGDFSVVSKRWAAVVKGYKSTGSIVLVCRLAVPGQGLLFDWIITTKLLGAGSSSVCIWYTYLSSHTNNLNDCLTHSGKHDIIGTFQHSMIWFWTGFDSMAMHFLGLNHRSPLVFLWGLFIKIKFLFKR